MASTFTTNLRLELQGSGENRSSWGARANTVFSLTEQAIAGLVEVTISDANMALTAENGVADQARAMFLRFTGALTQDRTVTAPMVSKMYVVFNATTGGKKVIFKTTSGANQVVIPPNQWKLVYTDGNLIYTNDSLSTPSLAGQRWDIDAYVDVTGMMEIGRYIDFHNTNEDSANYNVRLETGASTTDLYVVPSTGVNSGVGGKIWTVHNDGPGSGLDADTVDGKQAADLFFPAGTVMLFAQTAAPTGWTKLTTNDNAAIRVVSGTAGTGGSVNFTTAFASQTPAGTVGGTSLTEAQLPAHDHPLSGTFTTGGESADHAHLVNGNTGLESHDHTHNIYGPYWTGSYMEHDPSDEGDLGVYRHGYNAGSSGRTQAHYHNLNFWSGGRNAGHTHNVTLSGNTGNAGSGSTHAHTFTGTAMNLAVKYVDVIMASKN